MKDMNSFERGRITGMAGTKTTVTLHPQTLGVRMRNSVIRMLENRTIEGGWSSQSRRLAETIAEKFDIQCSIDSAYRGMRIVGLAKSAAPHVAEVVRTDWTAWLLENPEYRNGYYKNQYEQAMRSIEVCDKNFWIVLQDKVSNRKVVEILAQHTTDAMKEKSNHVVSLLRGTEPIHLITF